MSDRTLHASRTIMIYLCQRVTGHLTWRRKKGGRLGYYFCCCCGCGTARRRGYIAWYGHPLQLFFKGGEK